MLRHLAVIMDGNGRWAEKQGLPRGEGHKSGALTLREIAKACIRQHIEILSVYAFSTENWKRPQDEVSGLMNLISLFFKRYVHELHENGIWCRFAGDISGMPASVRAIAKKVEKDRPEEIKLQLVICLNYGGRDELVRAFRSLSRDVRAGVLDPSEITEDVISSHLDLADLPDPDLIIRPGGEKRLSNFWLWQSAYSEFYFCDTLWPDFTEEDLKLAVAAFESRDRRFGGVNIKESRS